MVEATLEKGIGVFTEDVGTRTARLYAKERNAAGDYPGTPLAEFKLPFGIPPSAAHGLTEVFNGMSNLFRSGMHEDVCLEMVRNTIQSWKPAFTKRDNEEVRIAGWNAAVRECMGSLRIAAPGSGLDEKLSGHLNNRGK